MNCARCDREIRAGEIRYLVQIRVWADDGGYVSEADFAELDGKIAALIRLLEREDPRRLERQVLDTRRFALCPDCRQVFLANPLNLPLDSSIPDKLGPDDELWSE
jgi:hypothetical protein